MTDMVCDHGQLRRQCPLCDAAAEIATLQRELAEARQEVAEHTENLNGITDELEKAGYFHCQNPAGIRMILEQLAAREAELARFTQVGYALMRESDPTFPRFYRKIAQAQEMASVVNVRPEVVLAPIYAITDKENTDG